MYGCINKTLSLPLRISQLQSPHKQNNQPHTVAEELDSQGMPNSEVHKCEAHQGHLESWNTQVAEPHLQSLRICISSSIPSDADAVGLGATLWELLFWPRRTGTILWAEKRSKGREPRTTHGPENS